MQYSKDDELENKHDQVLQFPHNSCTISQTFDKIDSSNKYTKVEMSNKQKVLYSGGEIPNHVLRII